MCRRRDSRPHVAADGAEGKDIEICLDFDVLIYLKKKPDERNADGTIGACRQMHQSRAAFLSLSRRVANDQTVVNRRDQRPGTWKRRNTVGTDKPTRVSFFQVVGAGTGQCWIATTEEEKIPSDPTSDLSGKDSATGDNRSPDSDQDCGC